MLSRLRWATWCVGTLGTLSALALGCGGGSSAPTVELLVTDGAGSARVDGLSTVELTAAVTPADAVVSFASTAGLLTATTVQAQGGVAKVTLIAPFESDVDVVGADVHAVVDAHVAVGEAVADGSADVVFVFPTDGAPRLEGGTVPDRVVAGGDAVLTVNIHGTRLPGTEAQLRVDRDDVVVPPTLTLTQEGIAYSGSFTVAAPSTPGTVMLEIQVGTVVQTVPLVFIADGEAAFDLTGDFVNVVHGATTVSDFWLLDGDNQCAIATSISVAHIVQDGDHLTVATEACEITMPEVRLIFGAIQPTVDATFVQAANDRAGAPLSFTLSSVGANAPFSPPIDAYDPLVVGANLADPRHDPLPQAEDDGRVTDDDHDGHPGVTVHAFGDRYTAYRTTASAVSGTIESSNRIVGTMRSDTETVVFGGDGGGPAMTPEDSPMLFLRLDGRFASDDFRGRDGNPNNLSCADVMAWSRAQMATAFPPPGDEACQ